MSATSLLSITALIDWSNSVNSFRKMFEFISETILIAEAMSRKDIISDILEQACAGEVLMSDMIPTPNVLNGRENVFYGYAKVVRR